jgi:hypothetical protein
MLSPDLKSVGDSVIASVKAQIDARIAPLQDIQRELIGRLDKQSQALSAVRKQLAALERKGQP